jgi:hypothetical protein
MDGWQMEGQTPPRACFWTRVNKEGRGRHTRAGAHGGVLDVEEGLGVGHGCRGLMELA